MAKAKSRESQGQQALDEEVVQAQPRQGSGLSSKAASQRDRPTAESVPQEASSCSKASNDRSRSITEHPTTESIQAVKANGAIASAEAFVALVNQGIDCWYRAGQMLIAWRNTVPDCFKIITKANPWLSTSVLEMFVRIGNKTLYPKVLLLPPMLANRASKLDYSEQVKLVAQTPDAIRSNLKRPLRQRKYERSLSEKLPTVGYFKLVMSDGKVVAQETGAVRWAIPIVLDSESTCWVQLLKP